MSTPPGWAAQAALQRHDGADVDLVVPNLMRHGSVRWPRRLLGP